LQILYEIADVNINMNTKIFEKLILVIGILKNLKNNNDLYSEFYDKFNQLKDHSGDNNINNDKYLQEKSTQIKEDKSNTQDFTINNSYICLKNNFQKNFNSENKNIKSKLILNRLNDEKKPLDRNCKNENESDSLNKLKSEYTELMRFNEYYFEDLYKELKNLLNLITEEIQNKKGSIFIGNLFYKDKENKNEDLILSIKLNICQDSKNLMLRMIDTTDIIHYIEDQSDLKFKNIFLKKFSHEFKNPLLNIKEICTHFYKSFESHFEQDEFKSKYSNIPSNTSSQCISSISCELNKNSMKSIKKKKISDIQTITS